MAINFSVKLVTNLRDEPVNSAPKRTFKRNKPKRKTLSELSKGETIRLKERSGEVCECCKRQRATEKAHVVRRWNSSSKPTAEDFLHLCGKCHPIMDKGTKGRNWLLKKQAEIIKKLGGFA